MSILIFIETESGEIKKSSREALSMGAKLAEQTGGSATAVASNEVGDDVLATAGANGVAKVLKFDASAVSSGTAADYAAVLCSVVESTGSKTVVMANSSLSEAAASRMAVRLGASAVTNVLGLPDTSAGFVVKKGIYTGKAFCDVEVKKEIKILTLKKNSFDVAETGGSASVEEVSVSGTGEGKVKILEVKKQEGDILLPEADLVVSAGRGLKGPENWGMVEELAGILGAATACSKPVSDADWRPHHEHVGQTGIKVSPNLYIAIGISGAIQHLAGVSSSKVIVVVNTDPEAPFFKAADYGVVGDAFEVVPKLIAALKN